jgi:DNA-binding transcriptional MerR regulator
MNANKSKSKLTIKQVALQTGLSEYTLRYYEKVGLIQPVERNETTGYRQYDLDIIETVEALACLRTCGLSLDDMRAFLQFRGKASGETIQEKRRLFAQHAAALDDQIAKLETRRDYLRGKVDYWEAIEQGDTLLADHIAQQNIHLAQQLR